MHIWRFMDCRLLKAIVPNILTHLHGRYVSESFSIRFCSALSAPKIRGWSGGFQGIILCLLALRNAHYFFWFLFTNDRTPFWEKMRTQVTAFKGIYGASYYPSSYVVVCGGWSKYRRKTRYWEEEEIMRALHVTIFSPFKPLPTVGRMDSKWAIFVAHKVDGNIGRVRSIFVLRHAPFRPARILANFDAYFWAFYPWC